MVTKSDGKFDPEVKSLIAMKAGFQCSYPGCGVLTGIPREILNPQLKGADEFSETLLAGEAAHIVARSKSGPRGAENYPEEKIDSEENGIWLCANHHRMIDTLRETYGVDEIRGWKKQQEETVKTVSEKIIDHQEPELYIDEPSLNKLRFSKCVNAKKIITALEKDEDYRDQDLSFFSMPTFLDTLNNYFKKWTTVPYRSRKLASVALLRVICDEGASWRREPLWFNLYLDEGVLCPLTLIHESLREINPKKISSDGSLQRMIDVDEFFELINTVISLDGCRMAWLTDNERTFYENDLVIKSVKFPSKKEGYGSNEPNVWELIRYVYKEYYLTNPEKLVDNLIVHGNASILDILE